MEDVRSAKEDSQGEDKDEEKTVEIETTQGPIIKPISATQEPPTNKEESKQEEPTTMADEQGESQGPQPSTL